MSEPAPGSVSASAAGDEREPFLFEFLASVVDEGRGAEAVVRGQRQRGGAACPAEFLDGDGCADGVHARAAVGFGDVQAEQSHRSHFADGRPVEGVRLVHFAGFGLDFRRHKIVDGFLPHALFFVQVEIHAVTPGDWID
jgi:hypothetical protein